MKTFPLYSLLLIIFFSKPLHASEKNMLHILQQWDEQVENYFEKIKQAPDEESRHAILQQAPQPDSIASALWNSTSAQSGERRITLPRTDLEKKQGRPARTRNIPSYQYEEKWAAPAIAWWIQYPNSLKSVINKQQLPRISDALIQSIEKTHYRHPAIANACAALAKKAEAKSLKLLHKIHQKNPDKKARALAALALSIILDNKDIRILEGNEESIPAKQIYYIRFALQNAPLGTKYGHNKLDSVAIEQLYKINKLSIGRTPPQFTVKNLRGQNRTMPTSNQAYILFFCNLNDALSREIINKASALQKNYPGIHICPITTGYDTKELLEFIDENRVNPDIKYYNANAIYIDEDGKAGSAYRIHSTPTAALISHRGTLLYLGYPDIKFQSAINNYANEVKRDTAALQRKKTRLTPDLQKATKPTKPSNERRKAPSHADDKLPALRPLPQF